MSGNGVDEGTESEPVSECAAKAKKHAKSGEKWPECWQQACSCVLDKTLPQITELTWLSHLFYFFFSHQQF